MNGNIEQLMDRADVLLAVRNHLGAIELYNQVLELNDTFDEAYLMRGEAYGKLGQLEKAFKDVQQAIQLDPKYDVAYLVLAQLYQAKGNIEKTILSLQQAIGLNATNQEAFNLLVQVYTATADQQLATHQPEAAIKNYSLALSLVPENYQLKYKQAFAVSRTGNFEQAKQLIKSVINADINNVPAKSLLATIYEKTGEMEKGWAIIENLANNHPQDPTIIISFAKYALRNQQQVIAIEKLKFVLKQLALKTDDKLSIHMLLGKLYDSIAEYKKAFQHYKQANDLKYNDYDVAEFKMQVSSIISTFSAQRYNSLPSSTNDSKNCIFILGMPRSGTSLIEQIISSHSNVYGGGELQNVPNLIKAIQMDQPGVEYSQLLNLLTAEQFNLYADELLTSMQSLSPESKIVTDKLPHNFLFIGLIHKLLPNAKIINCLRNPVDNCLSCYFQHFGGYHPYAYNLSHLGEYYLEYRKLMEHWENVLKIPILNLHYEDLVNDTEREVANILNYLELDWEDSCLKFYKNKRAINTASYTQVSKRIYTGSMNRWKNYQAYIGELSQLLQ